MQITVRNSQGSKTIDLPEGTTLEMYLAIMGINSKDVLSHPSPPHTFRDGDRLTITPLRTASPPPYRPTFKCHIADWRENGKQGPIFRMFKTVEVPWLSTIEAILREHVRLPLENCAILCDGAPACLAARLHPRGSVDLVIVPISPALRAYQ